jgi:hypothetical protein
VNVPFHRSKIVEAIFDAEGIAVNGAFPVRGKIKSEGCDAVLRKVSATRGALALSLLLPKPWLTMTTIVSSPLMLFRHGMSYPFFPGMISFCNDVSFILSNKLCDII